ncbi:hypothetical protein GBA52_014425 [Prunus armeniaca]|nr:hypothetical protein GBA52_014425 [Prunus armeniaca]
MQLAQSRQMVCQNQHYAFKINGRTPKGQQHKHKQTTSKDLKQKNLLSMKKLKPSHAHNKSEDVPDLKKRERERVCALMEKKFNSISQFNLKNFVLAPNHCPLHLQPNPECVGHNNFMKPLWKL